MLMDVRVMDSAKRHNLIVEILFGLKNSYYKVDAKNG